MDSLKSSGWRLSSTWTPTSKSPKEIQHEALNSDLKSVGESFLADLLASVTKVLHVPDGGIVLQVSKIRNVAAPKANEESGTAPRMLKLSLSDGHTSVQGVEMAKLDRISLKTPPGTKVRLKSGAEIPYSSGFLQLEAGHVECLGGRVEALAEKWEIGLKLAQFTRAKAADVGGAPPWIPFGKKIQQNHSVDKNFKALDGKAADNKKEVKREDKESSAEFDSQRKDAIEEATKQGAGGKKVFGGGKADIKDAKSEQRRNRREERQQQNDKGEREKVDEGDRGGGRGGKRGRGRGRGRHDEGEAEGYSSKPSANVSLFDFLDHQFPGAHDSPEEERKNEKKRDDRREKPQNQRENNRDRGEGGAKRGGRQDFSERGRGGRGGGRDQRMDRGGDRDRGDRFQDRGHERRDERGGGRGGRGGGGGDRYGGGRNHDDSQQQFRDNRRGGGSDRGGGGDRRDYRDDRRRDQDNFDRNRRPPREPRPPRFSQQQQQQQQQQPHHSYSNAPPSDRDFGEWSNSTYHDSAASQKHGDYGKMQRQQHRDRDQQHYDMNDDFRSMRLSEEREPRRGGRHGHHHHQQEVPPRYQQHDDRHVNGHYQKQSQQQQQQGQAQQQPPPRQQQQQQGWIKWNRGDNCLAKYWEDGQYYPAEVTAMSKTTAVVFFKEYGNHEEVMLSDLLPVPQRQQQQQGGEQRSSQFIPATPGLPPAFPQS